MKKLLLFLPIFLLIAGCSRSQSSTPAVPQNDESVQSSITLGAQYITRACKPSGEFVYLDHLDPSVMYPFEYNELRHAGALYPLGEYYALYKRDPQVKAAMVRAAKFFVKKYVAPIADTNRKIVRDTLGSWTVPADEGKKGNREVKLGGNGLGLVGLLQTERAARGTTPLTTLRGLGNGILFLQERDGSFYSKYDPLAGGMLDRWDSLYYPGEAALGLAMLYEYDPDPKQKARWLNAAYKTLAYLATLREQDSNLVADHWALIATARLWPHYPASDQSVSRNLILEHAVKLCRFILNDPDLQSRRTTPVSTRLEGLIPMLGVLPPEHEAMRQEITMAAHREIARLIHCQVKSGELAGAIPRSFAATPPVPGQESTQGGSIDRSGEVRIDYVQHALSALMSYDQIVLKSSRNTSPSNR